LTSHTAAIGNPAPLKDIKLESNIKVEKKVDYLVNDTDVRATRAIEELYNSRIPVSNIMKVLSAGMLGKKFQRKLVPTRWSITSVDDSLSKMLLEKIRYYQEISEILVFHGNYLGNYYEIFLIPGCWGFEILEASSSGYFGEGMRDGSGQKNENAEPAMWHDYEFFQGRKTYASSVTGGYYAVRLPVCEYLEKIKRQASVLIFREIRPEYWAPCGVGILRELVRGIMEENKPEKFISIEEAFKNSQARFQNSLEVYKKKSVLLKEKKQQKRLFEF
jgi:DNA repair protein NreA